MGKILQELRAAGAALTCSGLGQDTGFAHGREEIQIPNIPKSWILQGLCFRENSLPRMGVQGNASGQ